MSKLTAHLHPSLPKALQLEILPSDEADAYFVKSPNCLALGEKSFITELAFQEGPIQQMEDVNGLSNEALIAVLVHRLNRLNRPPYSCRENALAITNLEQALHWLHERTRLRLERKVEGTSQP